MGPAALSGHSRRAAQARTPRSREREGGGRTVAISPVTSSREREGGGRTVAISPVTSSSSTSISSTAAGCGILRCSGSLKDGCGVARGT
jgi:hypothetical protein